MSDASLLLVAPLAGWCLPLSAVPDPVFAQRMAGDGVAIDPTAGMLHAPCDGEVAPMRNARHAVTLRCAYGVEVLVHVGIDTVKLDGDGFDMFVSAGQRVSAGEALLRFDLDRIARRAPSLASPVVIASGGEIVRRAEDRRVEIGEFLMELAPHGSAREATGAGRAPVQRSFRVPFDHGLHVRPAALVAAALRPFAAEVTLVLHGRSANARSTVAMMSLGAHCGDTVMARATGIDAQGALEALAAVLAPAIEKPAARAAVAAVRPHRIEAVIASRGIAIGQAQQWTQAEIAVEESSRGEAQERAALASAIDAVRERLDGLARGAPASHQALIQAHAELVQDPQLAGEAHEWIARGKGAGYAWREATRSMIDALASLGDARMLERAADLRDLENQVLRVLRGEAPVAASAVAERAVVLADDLLPSQFMALDAGRVAGVCLARGGATSHVALLAAASGIPALVAAGAHILDIPDATPLVLDAERGWLAIDPPAAERDAVARLAAERAAERAADLEQARLPCTTLDGVRIVVNANVGSADEARAAVELGAEGCGLLRTEFLFLERREPPDEDEQRAEYERIAAALGARPLNVRTLDVGGDKPIAYLPMPREDNPALGLRGVRASLWRPDLLRTQVRAVLGVKPAGQCRLLLPMVNDLGELRTIRTLVEECARELGVAPPPVGVMIETPAAALLADQLVRVADYLSFGTNDLSQYTLAIDRGHPQLAKQLDALHPAVLRLIAVAADAAATAGKSVSVCGALASDPEALAILIGLGVHEISATPAMIPRLKRAARRLDSGACRALALRSLEQDSGAAVRALERDPS